MKTVYDDVLQEIAQRLVEQFQPEPIILFGSQVWGVPTASSDIDLMVIISQSDLSDYERAGLGHRCLSGLHIAKDVVVKTRDEFDSARCLRRKGCTDLSFRCCHQKCSPKEQHYWSLLGVNCASIGTALQAISKKCSSCSYS